MASSLRKVKLNNGVEVPIIGTGSYPTPESRGNINLMKDWLLSSLKNGFRHIDTAYMYGTENVAGAAIKASGIPREEIFVTTKLPWNHQDRVAESFHKSLEALGTGYIDLYLIHWPQAFSYQEGGTLPKNPDGSYKTTDKVTFNDAWAEMEKLLDTGKVRAIGVSNFSIKTLEKLLTTAKVTPAVNQVELHPYLAQNELRDYCTRKGIALTAYTPSGYSPVRDNPLIVSLAKKYKVTPTQVIFAWHLSRNTIILPTSKNPERQKENITIPTLSEEDLGKIWGLDRGRRLCLDADPTTGQLFGWTLEQLGWETYPPKVLKV